MNTGNKINGINQWFVNALRDENSLTNTTNFINNWTKWNTQLAYQTNTTINTRDVILDNPYFDITSGDYSITLKRSPGAEDKWIHAIAVSLASTATGSYVNNSSNVAVPSGDANDWVFRIDTIIPTTDILEYYDVRQCYVASIDVIRNTLKFTKTTPWVTGDEVVMFYDSPTFVAETPYQLAQYEDLSYGLTQYDNISKSYKTIELYDTLKCYTLSDITSTTILNDYDLLYDGTTILQYRKVTKSWVQYATGDNSFLLPVVNSNIVILNDGKVLGRNKYSILSNKITLRSAVEINNLEVRIPIPSSTTFKQRTDKFVALDGDNCKRTWWHTTIDRSQVNKIQAPAYITGVQGVIDFIDGYAERLSDYGFIFNDYERPRTEPDGRLASWQTEIERFVDKVWRGFNTRYDVTESTSVNSIYDYHEVNPFKNELWLSTPTGVVADVLQGPYRDISLSPVIYDQYGAPIASTDNFKIYRTDKETHFTYFPVVNTLSNDQPRYISGIHVFIDYYEHIIVFNDFTTTDNLLHDSFLGLTNEQIDIEFYRHFESTKRPNSGGSVLIDGSLVSNIEAKTTNLQDFYNTYADNEQQLYISDARQLVGYDNIPYFGNINSKAKFLFWKGMIHYKGSNNCIKMFAKPGVVDSVAINEVWAYKLSDYGSTSGKVVQDVAIYDSDIVRNNILYQFTDNAPDRYFTAISRHNLSRWLTLSDTNNGLVGVDVTEVMRFQLNQTPTISSPHPLAIDYNYKQEAIRTNLFDRVELYVEQNYGLIHTVKHDDGQIVIPDYVVGSGMITCYANKQVIEVVEVDSTSIKILNNKTRNDITIAYGRGKLVEGVHYTVPRSNLIRLNAIPVYDVLDLYLYNNSNTLNVNIIDTVNDIKVHDLHFYDPARGIHNPQIHKNVKYLSANDPANYTDGAWNQQEVGVKWLDTTNLGYYNYHDTTVYPDITDRVALWGSTSLWSHITCYEWVESSIPPSEWAAAVTASSSNNSSNTQKYTGRPISQLQKRTLDATTGFWSDWYNESTAYQVFDLSEYVVDNSFTFMSTLKINTAVDTFKLYVNEIERSDYTGTIVGGTLTSVTVTGVTANDIIRMIRFADKPTIDPASSTGSGDGVMYRLAYRFNTYSYLDSAGSSTNNKYYFWATNQINRTTNGLSTIDIENLFIYNKTPYYFHQSLQAVYSQWVIKNITYIGFGYALQIINDMSTSNGYKGINTHNDYDEWQLISRHSLDKISRALWNKITESMIQQTLIGSQPLPFENIRLYDHINNANTRYGFKNGQIVGDATVLSKTILDLLRSSTFETIPVDKNAFLTQFNFNTVTDIKLAMDFMYVNFSSRTVNEIFFTILTTALSYTRELDGIFKTSYITIDSQKIIKHV